MRTIRSIDGKDIQWISMKTNHRNFVDQTERKQIGIVKPILSMKTTNESQWNYSELEKLEKRCSELIDQNRTSKTNSNEIKRFESLYSSMACQIFICPCLIRFYQISDIDICSFQQWNYLCQGYPMWIFNNGSNPRREKELRLAIIDEQTGFILWSDQIKKQSNLISTNQTILSFRHSTLNSFQMIRFQLFDETNFQQFFSFYREKQNFLFFDKISNSGTRWRKRRIKKSDISFPKEFSHWNHFQRFSFDSFISQRKMF